MPPAEGQAPLKVRRISKACDYCHRRSIRCRPSAEDASQCQNCIDFGQPCTHHRHSKRRGVKPGGKTRVSGARDRQPPQSASATPSINAAPSPPTVQPWRAPYVASQATIVDLVDIYFEIIYPIFPLFHQPTFLRRVSRGEYAADEFLFAATMATCALASARVRDGALSNPRWKLEDLREPRSEEFYVAAKKAIQVDLTHARDHNAMRACAVLAITAIQYGKIRDMHQHLGRYHALVAMDGLHDEANWPGNMGIVETEERRRLALSWMWPLDVPILVGTEHLGENGLTARQFWSMYTLDIYTSVVFSSTIRCQEQQVNVSYPIEVDDDRFSDSGVMPQAAPSPLSVVPSPGIQIRSTSWLCGWNFTTDLYRILEYVVTHFRDRSASLRARPSLQGILGDRSATVVSQAHIRDRVLTLYANLPACFKETQIITYDMQQDRYGFQAANIAATIQLLRMVLFAASGASMVDRCQIASEVVNSFMNIPVAYLRGISAPLLHHLAGIGTVLGSVFEEPLSESDYQGVRSVLLSMAQLLENLDHGTQQRSADASAASASQRLRAQVARIDEYMEAQRHSWADQYRAARTGAGSSRSSHSDMTGRSPRSQVLGRAGMGADFAHAQLQIPADLFEDWPWNFEFAPTFD